MQKKMFKNFEWQKTVQLTLLLVVLLYILESPTQNSDYEEFKKQIMWIGISIPVIAVVIFVDYEILAKISPVIYGLSLISLVAVLFTEPINGATSWFNIGPFSFQPAEFAKIAVVLFMANVMVKLQQKGREEINRFCKLGIILATVAVPTLLIIKQPDYGTALVFLVALIFMLYVAGINKKYIITAVLLVVILVPLAYFFILPEHAKARIDVYLNPNLDPRGDGYNIIQSKLAIGAGQIFGMGLFKGNQTQLGYLYPKTTDFIFAVISEEMGFVVAGAIIVLYVILITKSIQVAKTAKDDLGSYIATGIVGIFFFHMLENIGMTMGLLPITGIPLPFVSYGGSSMLTNLTLIAILLNISTRRKKAMFIE